MPLDTYIAGSPQQIDDLGTALSSTVHGAISDQRYTLAGPRNAYRDVWQGSTGELVADTAAASIKEADHLLDAFFDIGSAISAFGERLSSIESSMAGIRSTARGRGLVVNGYLIEDVAPLVPMTYSSEGPVPPEVTAAIQAHQDKVTAFNDAADDVDAAISDYTDACEKLTDAIGETVDQGWLADLVLEASPGALAYLGDDVLAPLAERVGRSRAISAALAGLDGDQMGEMMRHLFASVNGMSDRAVISRLAELSERSGGALDRYLLVAGILAGLDEGEGLEQSIVSEGGGWLAGTAATAGTYAAAGALFGSGVGPVGTVAIGGVALIIGTGVGLFTSSTIDEWYDDAEFEDLIRDGLAEQRP